MPEVIKSYERGFFGFAGCFVEKFYSIMMKFLFKYPWKQELGAT